MRNESQWRTGFWDLFWWQVGSMAAPARTIFVDSAWIHSIPLASWPHILISLYDLLYVHPNIYTAKYHPKNKWNWNEAGDRWIPSQFFPANRFQQHRFWPAFRARYMPCRRRRIDIHRQSPRWSSAGDFGSRAALLIRLIARNIESDSHWTNEASRKYDSWLMTIYLWKITLLPWDSRVSLRYDISCVINRDHRPTNGVYWYQWLDHSQTHTRRMSMIYIYISDSHVPTPNAFWERIVNIGSARVKDYIRPT